MLSSVPLKAVGAPTWAYDMSARVERAEERQQERVGRQAVRCRMRDKGGWTPASGRQVAGTDGESVRRGRC